MRNIGHIFDKVMLAIGVALLILLWWQFPTMPSPDRLNFTSYTSSSEEITTTSKWTYLKPDKALGPREVIRIQMRALQENDQHDSGIITVFNFSSPKNKRKIGSINSFRLTVRDPGYRSILNFKSYKTGQLVITDNKAYQLVVVEGHDGTENAYLFILAKQDKGNYKGCWMTEGIARTEPPKPTSLT